MAFKSGMALVLLTLSCRSLLPYFEEFTIFMDKYKKLVSFQYIDDDEELDKAQRKKWRGKIKDG